MYKRQGHDVTLAVTRVRVSAFGLAAVLGIWGPSPGKPSVGSNTPPSRVWAGLHRHQVRARRGRAPWAALRAQPYALSGGCVGKPAWGAGARLGGAAAAPVLAARVATVRAASARAGRQVLVAMGLGNPVGLPGLDSVRDSGEGLR